MLKGGLMALGALLVLAPGGDATFDAEDALKRSAAAYAALTTYADSGTVVEQTSGFQDKFAFRTYFTRKPRNLFLNFSMIESEYNSGFKIKGNSETVIWMENGLLQTYFTKNQEHTTYPEDGGRQVEALKSASYGTKGISVLTPSLFYTKAGLASVVQATEEATAAGTETVDGRPCLKVMGIERWRYPSGQVTGVRQVTIWIDAETYLIRKIFQDTPKSMAKGSISRLTTTFRPYANPTLEGARFRYTVPE
jgi:outer membrane lipoprotein-sorting protein